MEAVAAAELILLALKAGRVAAQQIELMNLETLPSEIRAQLIWERDLLNDQMARLDRLGR